MITASVISAPSGQRRGLSPLLCAAPSSQREHSSDQTLPCRAAFGPYAVFAARCRAPQAERVSRVRFGGQ